MQIGVQDDQLTDGQLRNAEGFTLTGTSVARGRSVHSLARYDLIGKIAEGVDLTRDTVCRILQGIAPAVFAQFNANPEHFIAEACRIIAEEKGATVIERLRYDPVSERHDVAIFTASQARSDFSRATARLNKHIHDYAIVDSELERAFVGELDTCEDVVVYAKLPRGFLIPTPVGSYNPDWAICFTTGRVRHIYFVAETKGSLSSLHLREMENSKIECARKFFAALQSTSESEVRYDVVTDYAGLMSIVAG